MIILHKDSCIFIPDEKRKYADGKVRCEPQIFLCNTSPYPVQECNEM